MSEWHVSAPYQQQRHNAVPAQPAGSGVEWYSGGAQQYASTSYGSTYGGAQGGQGGAAYGSFEDEAPLLEGAARQIVVMWRSGPPVLQIVSWLPTRTKYHSPALAAAARLCFCQVLGPAMFVAELGIDIPAILSRTRSVLTFRLSGHDMDHLDLGGPLIFMALLGVAHLLVGTPAWHAYSNACAQP